VTWSAHALSEAERARIVAVANEPCFTDMPPARIVPTLADEGTYLASESSFHRVLRAHGQMNRRGRARLPRTPRPPTTHVATQPGDVWCWDVTLLPAQVRGRWFYRKRSALGDALLQGGTGISPAWPIAAASSTRSSVVTTVG
jgi:putative transposase